MIAKIRLDNEIVIYRKIKFISFGNFVMLIIRYLNNEYLIGNGDEYLRGYPKEFKLGKKLEVFKNDM